MLRGDHRVNEIKLRNALGEAFPAARARRDRRAAIGPPGFIGPVGVDVPVLLDEAVEPGGCVHRGRQPRGPPPARRRARSRLPLRARRRPPRRGRRHRRRPADHDRARDRDRATSSSSARATPSRSARPCSTSPASQQTIWMGSYGIGPARIMAAAVEQYADDAGISWPRSLAPWDVDLVGLGKPGTPERELAERLYGELRDDRARRPLRRPRRRPGREVRRRRAARLPAAADGRQAHARGRRARGAGAARA